MNVKFAAPFYLKLTCALLIVLLTGYVLIIGQLIIVPIVLGTLIAILMLPIARFLENKLRFSRSLASISSAVLFTVVIGSLFYVIGLQLTHVANDWPDFQQHFKEGFNDIGHWVQRTFGVSKQAQDAYINATTGKAVKNGGAFIGFTLQSISSILFLSIFTFLFTFFMLLYRKHLVKFLMINFKEQYHKTVLDVVNQIQFVVKKYLTGLIIQMAIVSLLVFIALTIIGVKYAWLIALLSGILNILPYIGILTGLLIAVVITFGSASISSVVFVILSYVLIHAVDGNYVMPKIVGSKVKINSLIAMIGIVLGEMVWGISGMFLALPIIAILKIVFDQIHEMKAWGFLLGEEDEEPPMFSSTLNAIFKSGKKEIVLDKMTKEADTNDDVEAQS